MNRGRAIKQNFAPSGLHRVQGNARDTFNSPLNFNRSPTPGFTIHELVCRKGPTADPESTCCRPELTQRRVSIAPQGRGVRNKQRGTWANGQCPRRRCPCRRCPRGDTGRRGSGSVGIGVKFKKIKPVRSTPAGGSPASEPEAPGKWPPGPRANNASFITKPLITKSHARDPVTQQHHTQAHRVTFHMKCSN